MLARGLEETVESVLRGGANMLTGVGYGGTCAMFGGVSVLVKGLIVEAITGVLLVSVSGLSRWEERGTAVERGTAPGPPTSLFARASILVFLSVSKQKR